MSYLRIASTLLAVAVPATVAAQPAPSSASSPYYQPAAGAPAPVRAPIYHPINPRVGWELDAGLMGGEINCSSPNDNRCDGVTEAGGGHVGGTFMFNRHVGINAELSVMAHDSGGWTLAQEIATVGIEWRPVPILSFQAGVGAAHASLSSNNFSIAVRTDSAPAVMLGVGMDVLRARNWALDVHLRFGAGFYGDSNHDGHADVVARNLGLGVGITWF